MENLLGFIVFVVIVAVSIINKIRTEAKESQEPREPGDRPISRDDIPEATRRMLYGDGNNDIIVAKPRTAASEHRGAPAPPHPVSARRVEINREGQHAPPAPPRSQPPRSVPQMQSGPTTLRQAPTTVRAQPASRIIRRDVVQQPPRPQPKPVRQPVRAVHKKAEPAPVRRSQRRKAQARPAAVPVVAPSSGTNLLAMLASRKELARGILIREILGPPKALEDYR